MAEFFTRPNFTNRQIVQRTTDTINLSGTTAIANPGYLKINQGAAPGLVATSLDFDGTVIWGPVSGLSWSISACTSPLYVNNIVACPSSAGTIVIQSGILGVNGALQLNTVFSGGTANDRLLVIDNNGFVKIGQTGTSISSLSYSNNNLILTLNDGSIFTATINTMTGLTINGNLTISGNTSMNGNLNVNGTVSATTFYGSGAGLTGIPDYYVTGGTYNSTTGTLTLNRQNGSITVTGFTSGTGGTGFTDNYVTGGTYNYTTGVLTLNRQNGSVTIPGIQFTGNTLATCITDIYVQNLYGCSNPITIQSSLKSAAGGSTAAGTLSFAFGNNVTASGNYSMAQGNATSTAGGTYAHAEGFNTLASGQGSHAEGRGSIASGNYSHAQGLFTNATTEGTFASGSGSTASGANSFVHSVGSTVSGNRSVVLGGFGINGTANDFVYVPSLNINTTPTNNNSNTQILSRNSSTGNVEYTDSSLLTFDTYVTGFSYNNANQLKISRNQGQPDLIQYINVFTGITVNGSISATTYYGDGQYLTNLNPIDTYVTGFTFTNNNTLTILQNQGKAALPITIRNLSLTGLTVNGSISATTYLNLPRFVTGATYSVSAGTLTLTTNYGTNINLTGFTSTDSFVTGYTFTNGNTLTITQNNGKTVPAVTINNLTLTGLTVNGSISASTYLNLPSFVTGGTYSAGTLTLNTNYGTNINITGFTNVDTYVTGFTYNNSNRITLSQNQGQPDLNLYINVMSGLTVAGSISASTYLGIPQTTPGAPVNSIQFNGGNNVFSGSSSFTFTPSITGTNLVSLNGNIQVTGSSITLETSTLNSIGYNLYNRTGASFVDFNSVVETGTNSMTTDVFTFGRTWSNTYIRNSLFLKADTVTNGINSGLPTKIFNFIASQNSNSQFEWHYNTTNTLTNSSTAKMILSANTGNLFTSGSYSTTALTLRNTPTLNNSNTQILVRNSTTGDVEYRDAFTLSGNPVIIDTFVTGFTFTNNNTLNIFRNQGQQTLSTVINNLVLTGLTVNGSISASTYLNLPAFIFTANTSASCITDLYVSNIHGCSPITIWDSVQNIGSSATGTTSFAFGDNAIAIGNYSHAEGKSNQAIGESSHAEGRENYSIGSFSHVEGLLNYTGVYAYSVSGFSGNTIVLQPSYGDVTLSFSSSDVIIIDNVNQKEILPIGSVSYNSTTSATTINLSRTLTLIPLYILPLGVANASGADQKVGGDYSHAEGSTSSSLGDSSHSEGYVTQSIGDSSHSEGYLTKAIGTYSHAEGRSSKSIGGSSHAEGRGSNTLTLYSHAEGEATYTGQYGYLLETATTGLLTINGYGDVSGYFTSTVILDDGGTYGYYTISGTSFSGTKTYIQLNDLTVNSGTAVGVPFVPEPIGADQLIGYASNHAEGLSTISLGTHSHAEGTYSTTIGDYSHAEGNTSISVGIYSHAEGLETISRGAGSHSEGSTTEAIGNFSHAEGSITIATGLSSHAEGYQTQAIGVYSHAEGQETISSGTTSHAEGYLSRAIGIYSHAEGLDTRAIGGDGAHAEGFTTQAIGSGSHSEGSGTFAYGDYSHAEGGASTQTGPLATYAHAEGESTKANGVGSHSQGRLTIADGNYSFASGDGSRVTTEGSFIHSKNSLLTGLRSVLLGGQGITGTSNDFVYVPSLNINSTPTNNNSATQVLVRNSSTGDVEYRNASTIGGGGTVTADTYVTGFTYNNANVLSITQNNGQTVPTVKIDRFTGLTVTNGLSADTLTLTTMPVTNSTSTQALVRNTTTGTVESRAFGLDNITLVTAPPAIPIAGVGPSVDTIKGIPQGQVITGYTTIYVNNVLQAGPSVTTNFGTYDNTTGLFTTNVNATLMINAWIHLKPDTNTSTAWSLSGTGEFGLGICPNNATDIYVGDYQTIIPDPDTAQYVYELYGANAPRTNQIDISTSTVIYAGSGSTFRVKALNKTDRNYAGPTVVDGDGIRFSITRIM